MQLILGMLFVTILSGCMMAPENGYANQGYYNNPGYYGQLPYYDYGEDNEGGDD
jgi:hypothetical protein